MGGKRIVCEYIRTLAEQDEYNFLEVARHLVECRECQVYIPLLVETLVEVSQSTEVTVYQDGILLSLV